MADRAAKIEQAARDIRFMLRESDKDTAVKIKAMITEALGDDGI